MMNYDDGMESEDMGSEDMGSKETGPIKGKFSPQIVSGLLRNFNSLMPLFGLPPFPMLKGEGESINELPAALVSAIEMIASAAEDYGRPGLIDLSDLTGEMGMGQVLSDNELIPLVEALGELAQDPEFKKFLEQPTGMEEGSEERMAIPAKTAQEMFMRARKPGKE